MDMNDVIKALTFEHDDALIRENKDPFKIRCHYYDFYIQTHITSTLDTYRFNDDMYGRTHCNVRDDIYQLVGALMKTVPKYHNHDIIIYYDSVDFNKGSCVLRWITFLISEDKIYWKIIRMKESVRCGYISETIYSAPELSSEFIPLSQIIEKHPFIISFLTTSCSYSSIINALAYNIY